MSAQNAGGKSPRGFQSRDIGRGNLREIAISCACAILAGHGPLGILAALRVGCASAQRGCKTENDGRAAEAPDEE